MEESDRQPPPADPEEPDYVVARPDPSEDASIDAARSRAEPSREAWPPPLPEVWDTPADRRYSLRHLFIVVLVASVMLAGLRLMSPSTYALILGLILLASRVLLDTRRIETPWLHLAWWTLGLLYLIAMAAAFLNT